MRGQEQMLGAAQRMAGEGGGLGPMEAPDPVPKVVDVPETRGLSLAGAFAAFSSAADSLERSYMSLGQEVCRLRKELEQERDLRRRREALAEISALVAHEIRNPLGSLELFAGLLAGSCLGDQEKDWVEQIQSGLRILAATVNNILEFHSQRPLELALLEVHQVLRSVVSLLAPVAARAGVRCLLETADEPLWIRADRYRLEQVFLNLALNAFRFAAQGAVLEMTTARRGDHVLIAFADQGPGIDPHLAGSIFEAGVCAGAGGTGLGLAVTKRIVEQHGGRITVTSSPEHGTSFKLQFPMGRRDFESNADGIPGKVAGGRVR